MLSRLLKSKGWSSNIRDDIIKVRELSERDNGETILEYHMETAQWNWKRWQESATAEMDRA